MAIIYFHSFLKEQIFKHLWEKKVFFDSVMHVPDSEIKRCEREGVRRDDSSHSFRPAAQVLFLELRQCLVHPFRDVLCVCKQIIHTCPLSFLSKKYKW